MESTLVEKAISEEEVIFEDGVVPAKRKLAVKEGDAYGKLLTFLRNNEGWTKAGDFQEEASFIDFAAEMWKHNDARLENCQRAVVGHGLTLKVLKKYRMSLLAVLVNLFNKELNVKAMNRTQLSKAIIFSDSWKKLSKDDVGAGEEDGENEKPTLEEEGKEGMSIVLVNTDTDPKGLEPKVEEEGFAIDVQGTIITMDVVNPPPSVVIEKAATEATLSDISDLEVEIVSSLGGSITLAEKKEKDARERMQSARMEVGVLLQRLKDVDVTYRIAKREVDEWNMRLNKKKASVDFRLQEIKDKAVECRTAWQQYQELGERLKTVPMSQDELQKWQQLCADCLGASKKYSTLWEELLEIKRGLQRE